MASCSADSSRSFSCGRDPVPFRFSRVPRVRFRALYASCAGHVVQYSGNPALHRVHCLGGRSTNRRTAAAASAPLRIGWFANSTSRSTRTASGESGTVPRSLAQVRQRYSTVSTARTSSATTSFGVAPRSNRSNTLAATSPSDVASFDVAPRRAWVSAIWVIGFLDQKSFPASRS
jgi:hypothetical protein